MSNTTISRKLLDLLRHLAGSGWDVVSGETLRMARRSRYVHVETDEEAGDGRKIARLTDAGAEWLMKQNGASLERDEDGSWTRVG